MNYNLIDEKWIPVLWNDGKVGRVGIKEALTQASRIRQIAASNPMDRLAIFRFLLAILYWCKGNPTKETASDSFPVEWFAKLDEQRDFFNLLGKGKRFYQDPDAKRARTSTDLLQEIPTGNNFWHFRHSTDEKNGLCPACCALGLLRLPLFSVSGRPDLMTGINGVPPIYLMPFSFSLLDTLWENWTTVSLLGIPAWVEPFTFVAPEEVVPFLTGLTMLSRRVWLHEPSESGICIACGERTPSLVRTCEFQSAGKQENALWDDPHVLYLDRTPRKSLKTSDPISAGEFRMDRPWTNMLARIAEIHFFRSEEKPTTFFAVGFATDNAKNIDVWERTIVVPPNSPISESSILMFQAWSEESRKIEKEFRIGRKKKESEPAIAAIRPHIENQVSAKIDELLTGVEGVWEEAAMEYRPMMTAIAQSLSPGFTVSAVQRREQIAHAIPDMREKTETAKKPARKKGDK